jgi:hypothetical protein
MRKSTQFVHIYHWQVCKVTTGTVLQCRRSSFWALLQQFWGPFAAVFARVNIKQQLFLTILLCRPRSSETIIFIDFIAILLSAASFRKLL